MPLDLQKLPPEARDWLDSRACSRGTSMELEAFALLGDAVHDRISRERLFENAARARVRVPGPPLTEDEIQQAIDWGRP